MEGSTQEYRLIFEGLEDSSEDAMRKIKGVFLSDLEMHAEEIMAIMSQTPATIRSADSPDKLMQAFSLLKDAGSKVLIVTKDGKPYEPESASIFDESLLFELEDAQITNEEPPTYSLNDESPADLELLLEEAAAVVDEHEAVLPIPQEEPLNSFTLKLDDELALKLSQSSEEKDEVEHEELAPAPEQPAPVSTPAAEEPFNLTLALEDSPASQTVSAPAPNPEPAPEKVSLGLSLDMEDAQPIKEEAAPAPVPDPEPASIPVPEPEKPVEAAPPPPPPQSQPKPAPVAAKTPQPVPKPSEEQNPTDINVVPVRDRRRKNLPAGVDVALMIFLGTIALFAANWMYFNAPPPVDDHETTQAQEMALKVAQKKKDLLKRQREEAVAREQEELALKNPDLFKTEIRIGETAVSLSLTLAGEKLREIDFDIQDQEPPELTNDEIARGIEQRPWIRRIDISPFAITTNEFGEFSAEAQSKVFVEQKGIPTRLIRKVVIQGKPNAEDQALYNVTLSLLSDGAADSAEDLWRLESQNGQIEFEINKKIELRKELLVNP